ncbi:hypothetical protein BKP42_53620 [Rhodococcus erythropolis]|uniref:hypothetical protein n=1 Tax=Rhodococcus erythropolis TaxID=1833 RepID=UPI000BB355F4|nr:hypothetical protein [Rhodococcus erythropolis]PBI91943.1 hypothetical protein BKP42_53620 [Rhodococcus erythropolis]
MSATLVVFAAATSGADEEFRRWYDDVHIPEVRAAYPEVQSVCRYDMNAGGSFDGSFTFDSVALYSVEGSSEELWTRMSTDRSLSTSGTFDYRSVRVAFW